MRPTLSPRHALFVRHYRKTGIAARAYLAAGYKPSTRNSLDVNAHRLLRSRKVQLRIQELDRQMAERTRVTLDTIADQLREDREFARETKQAGAAHAATVTLAKLHGLLIDRKETGGPGEFAGAQSAAEVLELVRKELGDATADLLASVLGKHEDAAAQAEPVADLQAIDTERDGDATLN